MSIPKPSKPNKKNAPLVRESSESALKLERRKEERDPAVGTCSASYWNCGNAAQGAGSARFGITQLELVDESPSGMGVLTHSKIDPGMLVTICPEGSKVPWVAAVAVRCIPEGDRFRVGLKMSRMQAAA